MHKTSEKIAKQKKVLTKAVLSSAKQLGLTMDQLAIVYQFRLSGNFKFA